VDFVLFIYLYAVYATLLNRISLFSL